MRAFSGNPETFRAGKALFVFPALPQAENPSVGAMMVLCREEDAFSPFSRH